MQIITRDKTDAGVPAVQTLRNSIMAASFMATSEAPASCSTAKLADLLCVCHRLSSDPAHCCLAIRCTNWFYPHAHQTP